MTEPPSKRARTRLAEDQEHNESQDQSHLRWERPTIFSGDLSTDSAASSGSITSSGSDSSGSNEDLDCEVLIVGAGPAGLMLACNLTRYGIKVIIVDDRPDQTSTGRGDGLQPKTIETFRQLGLADKLLSQGVKVYDICFWNSTEAEPLSRTSRQVHYPSSSVDTLDPYVLLLHQGMIENVLIEDLASHHIHVERNTSFLSCEEGPYGDYTVDSLVRNAKVASERHISGAWVSGERTIRARFVIGCDGAHSQVRKFIPQVEMVGESGKSVWGVIDGVLDTNFPDIWSKAVIQSHTDGSLLCIPREENMTRLYVELGQNARKDANVEALTKRKTKDILSPYSIDWKSVVWSSVYTVSQRVSSGFISVGETIFLVGDAAHTHSPKAAQGMNVSMHDSFNLAWKLNLFIRGAADRSVLVSYEEERAHVAQQLIKFDVEHAKAFQAGDAQALAENFDKNIRFISGVGVEYKENAINVKLPEEKEWKGQVKVGALLPPARVTRYIDNNPVHIQLDIPLLGQFRIYFLVSNVHTALKFLKPISHFLISEAYSDESIIGQASSILGANFERAWLGAMVDRNKYFGRYSSVSRLFTPAIVTTMPKAEVEITDLPGVLRETPWTFYLDNEPNNSCTEKWAGGVADEEVVVINVRPDGYVGSMNRFNIENSEGAKCWLNNCFSFLEDMKYDESPQEEDIPVYRSIFG